MTNPVLVEVTRGNIVESLHRGSICVSDSDGKTILSIGDVSTPVFPRSAVKAIQALPFVESGAVAAYGFGDAELSFACASHSGEAEHVRMARKMLERAGISEELFECGGHWSSQDAVMRDQARTYADTPPCVCNNCSGKHTGFLCTATHLGIDPTGYVKPDHPIQQNIKSTMEDVLGAVHGQELCGTDGCSIPTYAVPLLNMAQGFAKMATGIGLSDERGKAARILLKSCMNKPFYMAGTKRFCTDIMTLGTGRIFAKTGAEGVFCGALPELGLGIALKCDDGGTRGSEAMMAATLAHLLGEKDALYVSLLALANTTITNWLGIEVGNIRSQISD